LYETIRSEKGAGVATISLNLPDKLNAFDAFDGRMSGELDDALNAAATDDEVRCVVLRATLPSLFTLRWTLLASSESIRSASLTVSEVFIAASAEDMLPPFSRIAENSSRSPVVGWTDLRCCANLEIPQPGQEAAPGTKGKPAASIPAVEMTNTAATRRPTPNAVTT
jgi:hypothetical protein